MNPKEIFKEIKKLSIIQQADLIDMLLEYRLSESFCLERQMFGINNPFYEQQALDRFHFLMGLDLDSLIGL